MDYKAEYITGLYYKYMGLRRSILADLDVYISNPVGVGEHSNISEEVENKVKELDSANRILTTLQSTYPEIIKISQAPTSAESG
jgi:hypothetical protein